MSAGRKTKTKNSLPTSKLNRLCPRLSSLVSLASGNRNLRRWNSSTNWLPGSPSEAIFWKVWIYSWLQPDNGRNYCRGKLRKGGFQLNRFILAQTHENNRREEMITIIDFNFKALLPFMFIVLFNQRRTILKQLAIIGEFHLSKLTDLEQSSIRNYNLSNPRASIIWGQR